MLSCVVFRFRDGYSILEYSNERQIQVSGLVVHLPHGMPGNTANLFLKKKICGCSAVNLVLLKTIFIRVKNSFS